ncbi:MAG: HAMP domain-containing histidine kinase [Clostridia bacterium]|nr:HAMP domain-containing histidine kinase [Clostridia bacterium]
MNLPVIILSVAVGALFILLIVLTVRRNRRTDTLADSIEDYLQTGKRTIFSVRDDRLARLQNNINDLESRLELEKQNTAADNRRNADFVADVSHQLKTPLAGIRLYCEMLAAEDRTDYSAKELLLIEKTEKLIAGLLKFQKLQADSFAFDFREHSLLRLAEEQLHDFRPLFPQKQFSVRGDAVLRCDADWLGEALGNVIKNACEHTKADGRVDILIEQSENFVTLTVSDNGGGVPEEQLPKLFERFFRSANALPTGAGLGLAISRAIVEKHHGTVSAENGAEGLHIIMCFPILDGNIKL